MFVTRRPHGAKLQVKGAQRSAGYAPTLVYKCIPCLRVIGDWEEWPPNHVDGCPAVHHLQTNLIKSVEAPLDLYISILTVELTHTTLFL
jgi:hypothetical protein